MLSIITPVLNGAQFIDKLMQSIATLSIPHEHIVVDGGSTDDTVEIVSRYPNVRILEQQCPEGMYAAIQEGFEAAEGEFITWINSDDWVLKDGYEAMYALIASGKYDLVYSSGKCYYPDKSEFIDFKAKLFGKLLFRNNVFPCLQPATIYRKSIFEKKAGFNYEEFKIAGDIDFFARYAQASSKPFCRSLTNSVVFLKYKESLGNRNHERYLVEKAKLPQPSMGIIGNIIGRVIYKLNL